MRLTDRDKGRLFMLALVALGIIAVLLTDSCGAAPTIDQGHVVLRETSTPVRIVYETPDYAAEDLQHKEIQYSHGYEWVNTIDNFQITCPTRILRRDGVDFCVVVKCDGVGVTISCDW